MIDTSNNFLDTLNVDIGHQARAVNALSSIGPNRPHAIEIRSIYQRLFGITDTSVRYVSTYKAFDAKLLIAEIERLGWYCVTTNTSEMVEHRIIKPSEVVYAHPDNLLITFGIEYRDEHANQKKDKNKESVYAFQDYHELPTGETAACDLLAFYTPFTSSIIFNEERISEVLDFFKKGHGIINESSDASIGIISADHGEYYVKRFSLEGKTPEFLYPDLHYGEGFDDFHIKLLTRLKETTKGLVLLHGDPGTGKTQYIRILLKELCKINKSIIYAPPSVSASLTDPQMIEFLSSWIMSEERDCILLIEDAEPLIEARDGDGRSAGISNLLNMTDGILNDILGLTVIATFNTQISKIDSALLRPKRLIARKEFKKLPKDLFINLADALNTKLPEITYPATLAEFYGAGTIGDEILTHGTAAETKRIGFGQ